MLTGESELVSLLCGILVNKGFFRSVKKSEWEPCKSQNTRVKIVGKETMY